MKNTELKCPLVKTLEVIGDKWSCVILRDIVKGKRRYSQFCESVESIPTNILASRLKSLENHGVISRHLYQNRPNRYEYRLTKKGADLLPVLQQMAIWGGKYASDTLTPPEEFFDAMQTHI